MGFQVRPVAGPRWSNQRFEHRAFGEVRRPPQTSPGFVNSLYAFGREKCVNGERRRHRTFAEGEAPQYLERSIKPGTPAFPSAAGAVQGKVDFGQIACNLPERRMRSSPSPKIAQSNTSAFLRKSGGFASMLPAYYSASARSRAARRCALIAS